jgi:hypothetical protein
MKEYVGGYQMKCNQCLKNLVFYGDGFKRKVLGKRKDGTYILGKKEPL